ncbi:MAG: redoxin domain-containing protein [Acidimicrobiia bacterium]
MSPTVARSALVALAVLSGAAVWVSRDSSSEDIAEPRRIVSATALPVEASSAPAVEAAGWLNTDPLTDADLAGKVVLYDFWTFGCINCRHTIPFVKSWHERYAADGLIVLSIHTPEFDWEADPDAVAEFVVAEGITYPVALDPDKTIWRAFANHYWPAFYLHDDEGQRRYTKFGEGRYDETEDAIRALLDVDPDATRAEAPA